MEPLFSLHWLRENAYDVGTTVRAEELDSYIRERVLEAARGFEANGNGFHGKLALKLPYFHMRELRRRKDALGPLRFERCGSEIRTILTPKLALRTEAAELVIKHAAWIHAPADRDPRYVRAWKEVSAALQASLRTWIPGEHFRNVAIFADRDMAYPLILYRAARLYHGRGSSDFTYDFRDFPQCTDTLEAAWTKVGVSLQRTLARIERRLRDAGEDVLARHYTPRWHEDILREVKRRPRAFYKLMAIESDLINAVVDLGTARTPLSIYRFEKTANLRLRSVQGGDFRHLGTEVLRTTTRVLSQLLPRYGAGSFQNNSASERRT